MGSARWTVQVGLDAGEPQPAVFPTVVVVGVAPGGVRAGPRAAEAYPRLKLKSLTTSRGHELDHVRFVPGSDPARLPGLDPAQPSLVRDTVRVLLAAGAPTVDVLLVRIDDLPPWFVAAPEVIELARPVLETLTGVPVLFPDASGPVRVGVREPDGDARLAALVQTVRAWNPVLRRAYQVGLADLPPTTSPDLPDALAATSRSDFALCALEGDGVAWRSQSWRSASAVVGGMLATIASPGQSHIGRRIVLPPGHDVRSDARARALGLPAPAWRVPGVAEDAVCRVRLEADGGRAVLLTEPSMRGLPGSWPLPMLHAAKLIHDRLVFASNVFVFREATAAQAFLLQGALRMALKEFEDLGVITGPNPTEPPIVQTGHHAGPDAPSLLAQVTAYLRPWVHKLVIHLAVRPGDVVRSEVAA